MKDYKAYFVVDAPPEMVYLALTREDTIMLWTGYPATMSAVAETEFSMWDGNIVGKNLKFEENWMIVQQWYFGDQPEDSIVTLKLHPHKKGTSIELSHTNIPDEDYENMVEGWNGSYMGSLKEFYDEEEE
jgi:activator of HSP90 ATPase